MCAGNEAFFVALYLAKWVETPVITLSLSFLSSQPIALTWPILIAIFCLPISFMKNVINMVQLWKASKILVGVDLAERANARRAQEENNKKKTRS